ncbi:MAG: BlaI/MecI/CopY family transcriptional regulator [Planctomycetota bacterium]
MDRTHHLGALQHAIMRVLWDRKEATVAEVHEALADDAARALTTVATMLSKLEKKGVVAHRREGRQFVYRPLVSEREVRRTMVAGLTEQLFQGDFSELVNHLIDEQAIEGDELERIRQLIEEREAEDDA